MPRSASLAAAESGPGPVRIGDTKAFEPPRTTPRLVAESQFVPNAPEDRIGRVIHETYRIERLIAVGGMGAVYEAVHLRLQQRFAVKVLEHHLAHNEEAYARFRQEAEIAAGLNHPNIVQVFDFNHDESGNPYMVMELVEGTTLNSALGRRKLSLREALHIFEPLASALEAAHHAGIVHRDLKPNNVMVRRTATGSVDVRLLDFGISKMRDAEHEMTRDNVVMGTPNYMSPEQARGQTNRVDARTDIFALGAILYEILTGRRAFDQETTPDLLHAIVYEEPPALDTLRPDLPPGVPAVVCRCLAKSTDDRYQAVREVIADLRGAVRPSPKTTARGAAPTRKQPRNAVWGIAWALSVAGAAVGVALFVSQGAQPESTEVVPATLDVPTEARPVAPPPPAPTYADSVATPGGLLLSHGTELYRADRRGLTYWPEPEGQERIKALPSASAATVLERMPNGEILVGQSDGTVSRWDRELRERAWNRRIGTTAIIALAAGADYLAISTGTSVELLNGRTGRSLRRFPGKVPVVDLMVTRGPSQKLIVVREESLEVYDTDRRRRVHEQPLLGKAIRANLISEPAEGAVEISIDFDQGAWRVRRKFRVSSDRRGLRWRLEPAGSARI